MPTAWILPEQPSQLVDALLLPLRYPADTTASDLVPDCTGGFCRPSYAASVLNNGLVDGPQQHLHRLKIKITNMFMARKTARLPAKTRQKILAELLDNATPTDVMRLVSWMMPRDTGRAKVSGRQKACPAFVNANTAADIKAVVQARLDRIAREYVDEHEAFMQHEVLAEERQVALALGWPGYDDEESWYTFTYKSPYGYAELWQWNELRFGFKHRLEARAADMLVLQKSLDAIEATNLQQAAANAFGNAQKLAAGPSRAGKRKVRDDEAFDDEPVRKERKLKAYVSVLSRLEALTLEQQPSHAASASRLGKRKARDDDACEDEPARKEARLSEEAHTLSRLSRLTLEQEPSQVIKHDVDASRSRKRKDRDDDGHDDEPARKEPKLNDEVSLVSCLSLLSLKQAPSDPFNNDDGEMDLDFDGDALEFDVLDSDDDDIDEEYDDLEDFEREEEEANQAAYQALPEASSSGESEEDESEEEQSDEDMPDVAASGEEESDEAASDKEMPDVAASAETAPAEAASVKAVPAKAASAKAVWPPEMRSDDGWSEEAVVSSDDDGWSVEAVWNAK